MGTESLVETVDVELSETWPIEEVVEKVNAQLPAPIRVTMAEPLNQGQGGARVKESRYLITLNGDRPSVAALEKFLGADAVPAVKQGKKGQIVLNARPLVRSIELLPTGEINLVTAHPEGPELKPLDLLRAVFGLTESQARSARIIKTMQVLE